MVDGAAPGAQRSRRGGGGRGSWRAGTPPGSRRRAGVRSGRRWAGLLLAALLGSACGERPERLILVTIDTLRADRVGCYGAEKAFTPTLDALAASGVRFETAVSPAPLTLPSHATLLTGLDPPAHGVRHNGIFRLADEVPTLPEALRAHGYATAAFVGAFVLERRFGLARGFDHYDDEIPPRRKTGAVVAGFAERPADQVVDAALAWLEGAPDRFFLWVHLYDPHAPYDPPPGFAAALPGRSYEGEIAFADAQVGRLLAAIEERWPYERTLVAVSSDHGESLGEHGETSHAYLVYEATQRVPLLLRGPGLPPGRVVTEVAALRDLAPTLLDLADLPPLEGTAGRSLLPLVRGIEASRVAYFETLAGVYEWGWSPLLGVRTDRYKYIRGPRPELYDLEADPAESRDLAAVEPGRVRELDARLEAHVARAKPVVPNLVLEDPDFRRLEALGYVVSGRDREVSMGELEGPDGRERGEILGVIHRANARLASGRPGEALELLSSIESDGLGYHLLVSQAALQTGDSARAEVAARDALSVAPERPEGHRALAEVLEAVDRSEEAYDIYAGLAARDPEDGAIQAQLGSLAELAGRADQAAAHYERALAGSPPDPDAAWRLAALHLEAGREDEAERLLEGREREVNGNGRALERLARARARARGPETGLQWLEATGARFGPHIALGVLRADLLERSGREEEARQAREAVLAAVERELDDGGEPHVALRFQRARLLAELGRVDEAREALRTIWQRLAALCAENRRLARELGAALALPERAAGVR